MGFEIDVHPKYIQVFFIIWLFWRSQETILYKLCHTQYHYTSQSLFKSEEDCWPGLVMNLKLYSNPTTWRLESKAESTSCLEDTGNIFFFKKRLYSCDCIDVDCIIANLFLHAFLSNILVVKKLFPPQAWSYIAEDVIMRNFLFKSIVLLENGPW